MPDISGARNFKPVVPSNSDNNLLLEQGKPPKGIFVGGAGIIQAVDSDGTVVPFTVVAGSTIAIRPIRINVTGTTATLMNALY